MARTRSFVGWMTPSSGWLTFRWSRTRVDLSWSVACFLSLSRALPACTHGILCACVWSSLLLTVWWGFFPPMVRPYRLLLLVVCPAHWILSSCTLVPTLIEASPSCVVFFQCQKCSIWIVKFWMVWELRFSLSSGFPCPTFASSHTTYIVLPKNYNLYKCNTWLSAILGHFLKK